MYKYLIVFQTIPVLTQNVFSLSLSYSNKNRKEQRNMSAESYHDTDGESTDKTLQKQHDRSCESSVSCDDQELSSCHDEEIVNDLDELIPQSLNDVHTQFTAKPLAPVIHDMVLADIPVDRPWLLFDQQLREYSRKSKYKSHHSIHFRTDYNNYIVDSGREIDGCNDVTFPNLFNPRRPSRSPTLVVDCTDSPAGVVSNRVISEVSRCYQYYRRARNPVKLCIVANNALLHDLRRVDRHVDRWVCFWRKSLDDLLGTNMVDTDEKFDNFVYLTMDSENEFEELRHDHVYILGCSSNLASSAYAEHVKHITKEKSLKTMRLPVYGVRGDQVLAAHVVFQALLAKRKLTVVHDSCTKAAPPAPVAAPVDAASEPPDVRNRSRCRGMALVQQRVSAAVARVESDSIPPAVKSLELNVSGGWRVSERLKEVRDVSYEDMDDDDDTDEDEGMEDGEYVDDDEGMDDEEDDC
jgi:hypothetical protein